MGIVRLSGRLICADADEVRIVAAHLPEHVRLSRAEPGCLRFDVQPTADPLIWQLDEAFVDEAAFEAHQARNRASVWWKNPDPSAAISQRRSYPDASPGPPHRAGSGASRG